MKPISQREARRLRKRVEELERVTSSLLSRWSMRYPGGVHIQTMTAPEIVMARLSTAHRLGHVLVVKEGSGENELFFYAIPERKVVR